MDTNPFLLLGVSSDAEMSAIQSVGKRRLMALRLEDDSDPKLVAAIERALEQLADPVTRFEAGLFALELTAAEAESFRADPVLSTIALNPGQDGVAAYELICEADNPTTLAHNRGSLRFIQAVAATREAQEGTPDDISDDLACVELWKDAYKSLRLAFGSDRFWLRQKLRAKSYEDQRLGPDRVQAIRDEIYGRVVDPVGQVITRALLDRHAKVAKAYVDLLRGSSFDAKFVEDVLSSVYKPLADRVEAKVSALQSDFGALDADSESSYGLGRLLERFEFEVVPDLDVMLEVGDLPGYAEEHARDTAAEFVRSISVAAWNRAQNVDLARRASVWAARFADSSSLRAKIHEDAEFLKTARPVDRVAERLRSAVVLAMDSGFSDLVISTIEKLLGHYEEHPPSGPEEISTVQRALSVALHNRAIELVGTAPKAVLQELLSRAYVLVDDSTSRSQIRRTAGGLQAPLHHWAFDSDADSISLTGHPINRSPGSAPGLASSKGGEHGRGIPRDQKGRGKARLETSRGNPGPKPSHPSGRHSLRRWWIAAAAGVGVAVILHWVAGRNRQDRLRSDLSAAIDGAMAHPTVIPPSIEWAREGIDVSDRQMANLIREWDAIRNERKQAIEAELAATTSSAEGSRGLQLDPTRISGNDLLWARLLTSGAETRADLEARGPSLPDRWSALWGLCDGGPPNMMPAELQTRLDEAFMALKGSRADSDASGGDEFLRAISSLSRFESDWCNRLQAEEEAETDR